MIARRLGLLTWDEVEELPHVDVMMLLDIMNVEAETAQPATPNVPPNRSTLQGPPPRG